MKSLAWGWGLGFEESGSGVGISGDLHVDVPEVSSYVKNLLNPKSPALCGPYTLKPRSSIILNPKILNKTSRTPEY